MRYEIRQFYDEDFDSVMALVQACYGADAEPPQWWRWRHFGLKKADALLFLAIAKGQVVGMRPISFFPYRLANQPLKGALFSAVMIHPDLRRQGIFQALVQKSMKAAWEREAAFITTMPNDRSYPGFLKFGWRNPGDRPILVRAIGTGSVDGRALCRNLFKSVDKLLFNMSEVNDPKISKVETFSCDTSELMDTFLQSYPGIILDRDSDWFNWRYLKQPWNNYRRYQRYIGKKRLAGIAVTNQEIRKGFSIGYLVELIGLNAHHRRQLIKSALSNLKQMGCQAVISVMSDPQVISDLKKCNFFELPSKLSPKKFHTVYIQNPSCNVTLTPLGEIKNWYLTLGDWDGI